MCLRPSDLLDRRGLKRLSRADHHAQGWSTGVGLTAPPRTSLRCLYRVRRVSDDVAVRRGPVDLDSGRLGLPDRDGRRGCRNRLVRTLGRQAAGPERSRAEGMSRAGRVGRRFLRVLPEACPPTRVIELAESF